MAQALLAGDTDARRHAIATSVAAKAAIVAEDERETRGRRALLNLGHTFGHALEAETGFSDALLHGEAVALGMALAFRFSAERGLCPAADADRVARPSRRGRAADPPRRRRDRRRRRAPGRAHGARQESERRPRPLHPRRAASARPSSTRMSSWATSPISWRGSASPRRPEDGQSGLSRPLHRVPRSPSPRASRAGRKVR